MRQVVFDFIFFALLFMFVPNFAVSEEGSVAVLPSVSEEPDIVSPFFHMIPPATQGTAELTASENTWARFAPKSWTRFQSSVITGSESVPIRSLTEVKQILEKVDDKTYTLQRCVSVQTGAQELVRRPELITYNFYDRAVDPDLVSREGPCDNVRINLSLQALESPIFKDLGGISRIVPCYVRTFSKKVENRREETKIWYSPVIFPHLLKQESSVFILPERESGEEILYRKSITEIRKNSVDLRFGLAKNWMTSMIETDGVGHIRVQVTTLHSSQIPGGILGETAVEYDENGAQVSRSDSRLLDYYVAPR